MSIQMVGWALDRHIPDPAMKLVLISLCNAHNGKTGQCNPGFEQLCKETSLSRSTVIRKLKLLEEDGWITCESAFAESGRQTSNVYTLVTNREGVQVTPSKGRAVDTPGGVNCDTPNEPESRTESPQPPVPGGSGRFDDLKSQWPIEKLGNEGQARSAFNRLSTSEQVQAVVSAKHFLEAMRLRKARVVKLYTFLAERRFVEFHDGPELLSDGRVKIHPKRPEWSLWLGQIRRAHGENGVQHILKTGYYMAPTRWPEGYQPASAPIPLDKSVSISALS